MRLSVGPAPTLYRVKMQKDFQSWYQLLIGSAGQALETPVPLSVLSAPSHDSWPATTTKTGKSHGFETSARRLRPPLDAWGTPPTSAGRKEPRDDIVAVSSGGRSSDRDRAHNLGNEDAAVTKEGKQGPGEKKASSCPRDMSHNGRTRGSGLLPPLTGEHGVDSMRAR